MNSVVVKIALLLCALAALPATVRAQYTYTTNNGALTIVQYSGPGGVVTVPNTANGLKVTAIDPVAFFQVPGLTSLTFGTNMALIGTNAVFQCFDLTNVVIPFSTTNIGSGPFVDCPKLISIAFSTTNAFYSISTNALYNHATNFLIQVPGALGGTFNVSKSVTNVDEAFIGNALTNIVVDPANTIYTSSNGVLFSKDKSRLISFPGALSESYTIPTNVTQIISAAFEFATGVTNVSIGTNITNIGPLAFYDCSNLVSISVNTTNAFYSSTNGVLFDKNKTQLIQFPTAVGGVYIIPNTVTNIGQGAFGDAINLTAVVIPNGVTNIEFEAFYNCESLATVTMGSKVKNIADDAFIFCSSLNSIVFPAGLTNIGFEAFAGCDSLTSVCFQGSPPTDGGSIFFFDNALGSILYVSTATGWGPSYDGYLTEPCTACSEPVPTLDIFLSGTNAILAWPDTFSSFSLESATNLNPSPTWNPVTPAPTDITGYNVVTNPVNVTRRFYRLKQ